MGVVWEQELLSPQAPDLTCNWGFTLLHGLHQFCLCCWTLWYLFTSLQIFFFSGYFFKIIQKKNAFSLSASTLLICINWVISDFMLFYSFNIVTCIFAYSLPISQQQNSTHGLSLACVHVRLVWSNVSKLLDCGNDSQNNLLWLT